MKEENLEDLLKWFSDDCGGDPEAKRNAEIKLQVILAQQQCKTSAKLNLLTFCLVIAGLLNALVLAFKVWGK
jgi:hypothetical protein